MSLLYTLVKREKSRNTYMRDYYKRKIAALPRGAIVKKRVGVNEYYYLKYRKGNKTVTDYLGKDMEKIEQVRTQLQKRKHFEGMLSELNKEHNLIVKILEEAQ